MQLPELERALTGMAPDHHRFMLRQLLKQLAFLDEEISVLEERIAQEVAAMPLLLHWYPSWTRYPVSTPWQRSQS
jgi:hypothetical protein